MAAASVLWTPRAICSRLGNRRVRPMTNALVTGGAGFIGSHVADLFLSEGWDVTVVDDLSSGKKENLPAAAKFCEIGMTSADLGRLVSDQSFDVVAHLAGQID